MAKREGLERGQYPKLQWSFDFFWKNSGKTSKYFKNPDTGDRNIGYDAFFLHKGIYYGIEYKACANIGKFTFSAFKDLDKESEKLKHTINCGGQAYVIVFFKKFAKIYDLDFVEKYWDHQIDINFGGRIVPEIKDSIGRKIYDISIIIDYYGF